jgi:hypothetical protein
MADPRIPDKEHKLNPENNTQTVLSAEDKEAKTISEEFLRHKNLSQKSKNYSAFREKITIENKKHANGFRDHSHNVSTIIKDSKSTQGKFTKWYLKEVSSLQEGWREVLTQEWFRLIRCPDPQQETQAKTRLVRGDENKIYVISKAIPGFTPLITHQSQASKASPDKLLPLPPGADEIAITAKYIGEIDLNLQNLGTIDSSIESTLTKIDGGWGLSFIAEPGSCPIRAKDFEGYNLFYPEDVDNWFDCIQQEEEAKSKWDIESIVSDPKRIHEKNYAILKHLALTDELIKTFIASYVDDNKAQQLLARTFIIRRNQLEKAVLANVEFVSYLHSRKAESDLQSYTTALKKFRPMEHYFLLHDHPDAEEKMQGRLLSLRSKCPPSSRCGFFARHPKATGFALGFTVGASAGVAFLMMRALDAITFGASLTITKPLTIALFGFIGGLIGRGLGNHLSNSDPVNKDNDLDLSVPGPRLYL